jgi:cyclic beta-1,2-glucan synthetase
MVAGRGERADADRLLKSGGKHSAPDADIGARLSAPLSEVFAAQLAKRLRDQDPRTTPALGLLAERFRLQESSIEYVVQNAQAHAGRV